jgi:hypothetical protein
MCRIYTNQTPDSILFGLYHSRRCGSDSSFESANLRANKSLTAAETWSMPPGHNVRHDAPESDIRVIVGISSSNARSLE